MSLTINIPVVVAVVLLCLDLISLSTVFFQSYHDGQLPLLHSISGLPILSVHILHHTDNQLQGENNLY